VTNEYFVDWGAGHLHFDVFLSDLDTEIDAARLVWGFTLGTAKRTEYSPHIRPKEVAMAIAGSRKRWVLLLLGAFETLLLATTPAKTVLLDDSDNGSRLCANVGDTITVKLTSNPSTGYSWGKPNDVSQLQLVSSTFEGDPSSHPGSPGFQVFTWKATKAGMAAITLNYYRPFEKDTPPAKSYHLSITVEARQIARTEAAEKP
jgi:inhibitor of cysteine peptidase